ncbi:hypothetical protein CSZ94_06900 [Janthinobacterium sp. ROICE36]|uniref:hypothetical protein n=1 Tax=Janthinobacterium sp. ROICE36 TaxID=2048670 RepID=UPI000C7F2457|nr:hypothetical protein [Janthinobacterium sp. ROICE36]PLY44071.1 hypothetical protein CSZ94_06900 [Janthinobacterium sp. ROICE36]
MENSIEPVNLTGQELNQDEIIFPLQIAERYNVIDGKFYDKTTNALAFEVVGNKIVQNNDNQSS